MIENYYDALIECTLMIGVDEFTGLKPVKAKSMQKNLFEMVNFQHNILAVLSSTVAVFPFSKDVHIYPPKEFVPVICKNKEEIGKPNYFRQVSKENLGAIQELVNQYNSSKNLEKNMDLDLGTSLVRRTSKFQSRRKSCKAISIDTYKGSFGSISMETIKAFPGTYFNNNLKVFPKYIEPKIEYFPMTDNLGNRSYAFRIEFYRVFKMANNIIDEDEENSNISLESVFETDLDCVDYVYIPCYIVFFSKYPYFDLFKEILSQLFISINNQSTKIIESQLMEYSAILSRIPIMKVEDIQIDFKIDNVLYSIKPINSTFEQIIDWDMSLLFQLLSLDDIIFLLLALFQEQKIVFFSKYTNLVTLVCETLLIIFQPFSWKHFYLTVVPSHLYELIEAIFPFIMGLPHEHKSRVIKSYNDIIAVDLDEGTIHKPTGCQVKSISIELINKLKQTFTNRDWLMFREDLSDVNLNPKENNKNVFYQNNKRFSEKVMLNFMVMMVELFTEILSNIPVEIPKQNKTFIINLDNYFSTSHSKNIDFFQAIYQSDNFSCFLENKLRNLKSDGWSRICDQIYPELLSKSLKLRTLSNIEKNEPNILINQILCKNFILPTRRNERQSYFEKTISKIEKFSDMITLKKLKLQIYLQMGNPIKALETIYLILEKDKKSLDYDKVRKIISDLDKIKKIEFNKMDFSKSLYDILKFDECDGSGSRNGQPNVQQFYPPNIPIPKNQFYEICRNANITDFEGITDDLFRALTIEQTSSKKQSKLVLPEIFQCFYNNWIKISTDFIEGDINANEFLDEVLIIHTLTSIKVDDFGQGKILLTNLRLLFIPEKNTFLKILVNFTEETLLKMKIDRRIKGFGKVSEVLEITTEENLKSRREKKSKKVFIWFLQDIEVWYNLISEIGYGNRISYEEKDKIIQDKLTDQCLIYENLATCSKENSFYKRNIYNMSKIMLSCTMSHIEESKNNREVNSIHRKYIISKLMPHPKQSITIDCVLIISKPILKNLDLWCAVNFEGNSFLKRFEVINESIQSLSIEEIKIPARMKIMMHLMGSNKIIFGCSDGTISLFNTVDFGMENFNVNDIQGYHPTCGLIHYESIHSHFAYMGISNGELIQCQPNSKTIKTIMQIPENLLINFIELYDSTTLIIGSSHDIFIISIFGNIISKINIAKINTISNRISSLTMLSGYNRIIIGLHRLPVLIEFDITDKTNPICLRKTNIYTNKEFDIDQITSSSETSSKSIGISSILSIQKNKNENCFWFVIKDGTIEIRHSRTLEILSSFNAHSGVIVYSMESDLQNKKIIITVGRDDGKINLWNITPN